MKAFLSVLILLTLTACASKKAEQDIKARAQQSKVSDGQALGNKISDLIQSSDHFTDSQKKELETIFSQNKALADSLTEESFKFRGVLIKELLSGKPDAKKIEIIKNDIKKIEAKKLKNTFDTVEKISNIVSTHPEKHNYYQPMLNIDRVIR